jgi:hypothetical protein
MTPLAAQGGAEVALEGAAMTPLAARGEAKVISGLLQARVGFALSLQSRLS